MAESSEKYYYLPAIVEVCGIQGEEEGREDSSLWGPGVADHTQ